MFKLALICGGPSLERGISLNSARSLLDHLSNENLTIAPFYLDQSCQLYPLSFSDLYSNTPVDFDYKLRRTTSSVDIEALKNYDLVFSVVHGAYGEDGGIQTLLEKHFIPYIGSDSCSCRLMYPKHIAQNVLRKNGYYTPPSLLLSAYNTERVADFFDQNHLNRAVLKPTTGGSSIGVKVVSSPTEAIEQILQQPTQQFILEPFLKGAEFTVVVIQNTTGSPVALIPTEIELDRRQHPILDYRCKYLPTDHTAHHTPPRFHDTITKQIQSQAEDLFTLFGMRDFVRIDGWVLEDGKICFTDFNPLSGLEQNSFFFRQAAALGWSHAEALSLVLASAYKRYELSLPPAPQQKEGKKPVFVLFGNSNAERQVSLMSGANVWLKLRQSRHYTPIPCFYDSRGEIWELPYAYVLNHTVEEIERACRHPHPLSSEMIAIQNSIARRLGRTPPGNTEPRHFSLTHFLEMVQAENAFVFLALHGGTGENGTLQRELEQRGILFNGSGSEASRLCMDKFATGQRINQLQNENLSSLPKRILHPHQTCDWEELCRSLGSQILLIKPRSDGCSAGVATLVSAEELDRYLSFIRNGSREIPAGTFKLQNGLIELPLNPEMELMLEPFIQVDALKLDALGLSIQDRGGWIELTIGVLEQHGRYQALVPSITVSEGSVLSLEEKFQGGTGVNLTPPPEELVSASSLLKIQHAVEITARLLGIENYARLDIFYNRHSDKIAIIEANTLPALTPSTVIFHQALAYRPPCAPKEFLERLIACKERCRHFTEVSS